MTNKEFIQNLKQLKNSGSAGAPGRDFVAKNREILMMQIKNSSAPAEKPFSAVYFWRMMESVVPENLLRFVIRPVVLGLLVFGAAFGSWAATVSASYNSLPGDTLYGLKLAAEKAQLSLTSGDNKPSLQAEFAGRRLEEMAKIAERTDMENKEEKTMKAMANFQEHVKAVKTTLENMKDGEKAAEVAQMVDRKAAEFSSALDKAKENVSEDIKKEVDKASNLVTDTGIKAIEVIVKQSEQGTVQISQDEMVGKIQDKIQTVQDKVSQIVPSPGTDGGVKQEATEVLDQAKTALDNQQLGEVVDKLVEVKNLVNTAMDSGSASSTPLRPEGFAGQAPDASTSTPK